MYIRILIRGLTKCLPICCILCIAVLQILFIGTTDGECSRNNKDVCYEHDNNQKLKETIVRVLNLSQFPKVTEELKHQLAIFRNSIVYTETKNKFRDNFLKHTNYTMEHSSILEMLTSDSKHKRNVNWLDEEETNKIGVTFAVVCSKSSGCDSIQNMQTLMFQIDDKSDNIVKPQRLTIFRKSESNANILLLIEVYVKEENHQKIVRNTTETLLQNSRSVFINVDNFSYDKIQSKQPKNFTFFIKASCLKNCTDVPLAYRYEDFQIQGNKSSIPVLQFEYEKPTNTSRKKRSVEGRCLSNSTDCCVKEYTANFTAFGSDWDFIIEPRLFPANYCSGECRPYEHQMNVNSIIIQNANATNKIPGYSKCCAPTRLSEVSMLYINNNMIYVSKVPGLTVEKCGCF